MTTDLEDGGNVELVGGDDQGQGREGGDVADRRRGSPVAPSNDDPQYRVKRDGTGAEAAHELGAVERR